MVPVSYGTGREGVKQDRMIGNVVFRLSSCGLRVGRRLSVEVEVDQRPLLPRVSLAGTASQSV